MNPGSTRDWQAKPSTPRRTSEEFVTPLLGTNFCGVNFCFATNFCFARSDTTKTAIASQSSHASVKTLTCQSFCIKSRSRNSSNKNTNSSMKAPRTPSPTRARGQDDDAATSPASTATASTISELSMPETTLAELVEKSTNRRSTLSIVLLWMFCAGLFFFTTESIRYAMRVGGYGVIGVDPMTPDSPNSPIVGTIRQKVEHVPTDQKEPGPQISTVVTEVKGSKSPSQRTVSAARGTGRPAVSSTHRRLKMGRGMGRGGRRRRRNGRNNDLLFLNGGVTPQSPSNVNTELALTRVMTNVNVFQPGIGFLPQGTPLILAPAPRRRGMGMGMGMGGMGMMGMGGSRSRSKGRSFVRTLRPTNQPSSRPTGFPSAEPTENVSASPSNRPSLSPSQSPSMQPSVSKSPSSIPSVVPSSLPSQSNMPSMSSAPSAAAA